jgi:hypothetical protein
MQYATYHIAKGQGSGTNLGHHIDRTPGKEWVYSNADRERSGLNLDLTPEKWQNKPLSECVAGRLQEGYTGKTAIRKDAVKYLAHMLTGSHEQLKAIEKDPAKMNAWIAANRKFMEDEFGKENIIRFVVHLDEKTPHIHCITVPLTPDGRLSAKQLMGNPDELSAKQDRYAQAMAPFGLERGIKNTGIRHETVKEYYSRVNAVDIEAKAIIQQAADIVDNHKINPLNPSKSKEAIKGDLSDFLQKTVPDIGKDLIIQNRALKSEIRAMDRQSRYAQIKAAAVALKERIPILTYFAHLVQRGILRYEGRKGVEHYFARKEQKTGSLSLNERKNLWFDHAEGKGGDILKAAELFEGKGGFTDTVMALSQGREAIEESRGRMKIVEGISFESEGQKADVTASFDDVRHPALVSYLASRGISVQTAKASGTKELHWNVGDSRFFGLALPTEKGYSIRSAVYKGAIGGGVSRIKIGKDMQTVKVFEGMFDLLSYRQVYPKESFVSVVLNGTANLTDKLLSELKNLGRPVELYLNNDEAGKKAAAKALQNLPEAKDKAPSYANYNDLNEALLGRGKQQSRGVE